MREIIAGVEAVHDWPKANLRTRFSEEHWITRSVFNKWQIKTENNLNS